MALSKDKGNGYERDVAEGLTKIFGRNFKRNITGSGAHFGGGNASRKLQGRDTTQVLAHLGDVSPPTGYYVVTECKNYGEYPFHNLLQGLPTVVWDFLGEVRHDARLDADKEEVFFPHWLCMKVTRRGSYIFLPDQFFGHIFKDENCTLPFFVYQYYKKNAAKTEVIFRERYYVLAWEHLPEIKDKLEAVISDSKYFYDEISDAIGK